MAGDFERVGILAAAVVAAMASPARHARAAEWPQWCGTPAGNRVSGEQGIPDTFAPGDKDPEAGAIRPGSARNVKWAVRVGTATYASPTVAGGKVFIGTCLNGVGALKCFDAATGGLLWQYVAPPRDLPERIGGRKFMMSKWPRRIGVCSTAAVAGGHVYFVSHRCEVLCLEAAGAAQPAGSPGSPDADTSRVVWKFDMWNEVGARPSDICNGSPLVDGDFLYVGTSNGVDRDTKASRHDEFRLPPAPDAPSLIVLDRHTGRLLATDDARIGPRLLHGQWSSPSLGRAGGRKQVFFGGGDGVCYAFEALDAIPEKPVKLRTAWSCDCVPDEYKASGALDRITHYARGDRRRSDTINKPDDGSFTGMSEIVATPVFHKERVYVAIGRDPAHGRGRGALWCIDATQSGDVTAAGRKWCYQGLDRSVSTVSIADGLLYVADVAGRLHCLDAETGGLLWVYESNAETWASTLVVGGRVLLPTLRSLWVLAAGPQKKVLGEIDLGAPIYSSPAAADGTLFVASNNYLWAVGR